MPPQRAAVDLDLDVLAPEPRTFRLYGQTYELPGEVPIPSIIAAVRLQERVESAPEGSSEMVEALEAIFDLIMRLVRIYQPDAEDLPLDSNTIWKLFGLIIDGPDSTLTDAIDKTLDISAPADAGEGDAAPPTATSSATPKARSRRGGSGRAARD